MRVALLSVFVLTIPGQSVAQGYGGYAGQKGSWEWSIAGLYQDGEEVGSGGGSRVSVDDNGSASQFSHELTQLDFRFRGAFYNNYEVDGSGVAPDATLNAARHEMVWDF